MKHLAIAAVVGATFATFALPSQPVAAAPRGSYQESCRRVRDVGNQRNPVLSAQCRDARGRYRDATLAYRNCQGDIGNNNGRLVCAAGGGNGGVGPGRPDRPSRLPAGSWQRSCQPGQWNGRVLTARCENGNRGRQESRLNVSSCPSGRVGNAYGRLVCE